MADPAPPQPKGMQMKTLWLVPLGAALTLGGCSQTSKTETAAPAQVTTLRSETVEIGCGSCVYSMSGVKGCKLAAKIDDTPILVTGSDLDLHEHNLCKTTAEAVVTGEVEGDTLVVTSIEVK
jgi:hypothetical protein